MVYGAADVFVKEDAELKSEVCWLITNAQKNALEPILVTLEPGGRSYEDDPHQGEEFGYVLAGAVTLHIGERRFRVRKGDSFYFRPGSVHFLENNGKKQARVLWVSTRRRFRITWVAPHPDHRLGCSRPKNLGGSQGIYFHQSDEVALRWVSKGP